jgi:hypothetical protein
MAAAFGDGSNAGISLEFVRGEEALALFAEGREQPWSESGAATREGIEQCIVRQCPADGTDLGVEALNGLKSNAQLSNQGLSRESVRRNDSNVLGERRGGLDGRESLFDDPEIAV